MVLNQHFVGMESKTSLAIPILEVSKIDRYANEGNSLPSLLNGTKILYIRFFILDAARIVRRWLEQSHSKDRKAYST